MQSEFGLELTLPPVGVRAKQLLDLETGSVLALSHKVQRPISMTVAGSRLFEAFPVAKEEKRAGYIQRVVPLSDEEKEQNGFE
jgi:flagellar motor switch protein FliM